METLVIFESISEVVIDLGWFCLQLINWGKLAGRAFTVKIKFVQQKNFEIYKKSLLEKIIGQFFHPSKYLLYYIKDWKKYSYLFLIDFIPVKNLIFTLEKADGNF